jgi:hypothetical protein
MEEVTVGAFKVAEFLVVVSHQTYGDKYVTVLQAFCYHYEKSSLIIMKSRRAEGLACDPLLHQLFESPLPCPPARPALCQ